MALTVVVGSSLTASAAAGPQITNPPTTYVAKGGSYTVRGTATPGAVVLLHYHKQGTASSDYSIERSVTASSSGAWSRTSVLDVDYRVFATVGIGNPHSATVLFTSAAPPPPPNDLGKVKDVRATDEDVTLGVQFVAINGNASVEFGVPGAGQRFVSVDLCVRDRGPQDYSDAAHFDVSLITADHYTYPATYQDPTDGPALDLMNMAPGALRCGWVAFEVGSTQNITTLVFTPDSGYAEQSVEFVTP